MAVAGDVYCLFSWGANSYGQLCSGHKEDTLLPSKCLLESAVVEQVKQVTGGGGHSVLLTGGRGVYVSGWNKSGQLGMPPSEDVPIPLPLVGLPRITTVSCGWNHTLALSERGTVFVWGSNTFGQLGAPQVQKQTGIPVELPQQIFSRAKVCDIVAGLRHSLAVTERGQIYSWGDGKKGQLGHGKNELKVQPTPKCIDLLAMVRCKNVAAGAYHSVAITDDGSLFSCGLNQHGQCGIGYSTEGQIGVDSFKLNDAGWVVNVYQPVRVGGLPAILEAHCGWSHVVAISASRQVFSWGRSDYGQLGQGQQLSCDDPSNHPGNQSACCHEPKEISTLRGAKQVACGSEHSVAISESGEVVTFGWNEHGMCGTGDEANVQAPYTVESLRGWVPLLVGAGAGHSFVAARKHAGRTPSD